MAEPLEVNGLAPRLADREARVRSALELAGLPADFAFRYPHELSGGQRQRVVIAGALVMGPDLVVADEPVSMLDVSIRTELLRLMLDLRHERGLTYLFITHDLSLAWVIADRIAVMYLGQIMEIGPADKVIKSSHHPYTAALVSVSPTPDPPTWRRAASDDPRRGDARCGRSRQGADSIRAAPGVRPVSDRGSAALRCRWRAVGGMLAGRRRPVPAGLADRHRGRGAESGCGCPSGVSAGGPLVTGGRSGDAPALPVLPPATIADLLDASALVVAG